jgi:hypothetical protein
MKKFITLIAIACCMQVQAQDPVSFSGYTRTDAYLGVIDKDPLSLKSLYSETSLKIKARTGTRGQAYTDIRFKTGNEFGKKFSSLDIREAYLDLIFGKLEIRAGKQISPWGRADGLNPTDNLTPADYFVRSPEYDDMRLGSYRLRGILNPAGWLRIEADLVPLFTPSVYRFDLVGMPDFVTIAPASDPGFQWDKSSVAAKIDFIFPSIEGSVSWFKGYDPLPALKPGTLPAPPFNPFAMELLQVPFRQQTFGADFAAVLLGTGIRGEVAWETPEQGDSIDPLLPNPEIQFVLSLDRELGPFRIIAGYMGKYVQDFVPADPPQAFDPSMLANPAVWPMLGPMLTGQIAYYNRILYDQTHEWSHSILFRPSVSLFHESLDLEFSLLYCFTTGEYLTYPKISWQVTDGLRAIAGYQLYHGDELTRFSWIKHAFNGPFVEFRLNF